MVENGVWEPLLTEVVHCILHGLPPGTFVDVGSHEGYFSFLALCVGFSVVCVERDADLVEAFCRTVAENSLTDSVRVLFQDPSEPIRLPRGDVTMLRVDVENGARFLERNLGMLVHCEVPYALIRVTEGMVELLSPLEGYDAFSIPSSGPRAVDFEYEMEIGEEKIRTPYGEVIWRRLPHSGWALLVRREDK